MKDGIVYIENVGNLICPAEFDLGESVRLLAAIVSDGDNKIQLELDAHAKLGLAWANERTCFP